MSTCAATESTNQLIDVIIIYITVPLDTSSAENQDDQDKGGPVATEDISLVVVGKGLPLTRLTVVWEPRRRRLEVRVPAALAAALGET